jgi:hypothetical protein
LVIASPAGDAFVCVDGFTPTGGVSVPKNPAGTTAGVKNTEPDGNATMCDSAPANPVVPPHGTGRKSGCGLSATPPA